MSRNNYRNYYKDKDENVKDVKDENVLDENVLDENVKDVKDEIILDENVKDVKDENILDENVKDVKDENILDENVKDDEEDDNSKVITGVVANCSKLNVRRTANRLSKVLTVIEKGTEVIIDNVNTTNGFYKVKVNDIEGYCVKDFIEIK